jgi:EmrB/QacA subfamily drug resistance transporter
MAFSVRLANQAHRSLIFGDSLANAARAAMDRRIMTLPRDDPKEAAIADPSGDALRRARVTAFVLAGTMFMVGLDSTALITALPAMARDFGVAATTMSTTVTIYLMVSAVMLPVSGWIGQRFGSRRVFTTAIVGFIASSMLCGLSQSLPMFLAMRVSQAAFATLMVPVGNIVLLTITPKHYLVTAMTISSTPALIAPVLGPPLAGFITTFLEWRWIFFLNVPIALIALVASLKFIPNIRAEERTPFDGKGFVLMAGTLCAFISALDRLGAKGQGWELGVLLLIVALILGLLALRHARTAPHPIVPLTPLRYPCFRAATVGASMFVRVPFQGLGFTLPLMLQIGLGLTPFQAGLLLLAQNAGDLLLKSVASRALRWLGFRTALISGSIALSLSLLVCAALSASIPFPALMLILFTVGMARSILFTAQMALRFADMPQAEIGNATVLGNMTNALAQAFAISGVAALLNLLSGDADMPSLAAFRLTILVLAVIAAIAAPMFARLAKDAGAELTGRTQHGLREMRMGGEEG